MVELEPNAGAAALDAPAVGEAVHEPPQIAVHVLTGGEIVSHVQPVVR